MSSVREQFALFLGTVGPGRQARTAAAVHGEHTVAAVRSAWSGRVHGVQITAADVERVLGAPDQRGECSLSYALPGWPGYLYVFRFDQTSHHQVSAGFVRDGASPPKLETADRAVLLSWLASIGATTDEVREWLGEPQNIVGWWPVEDWHYQDSLVVEFRHGLVDTPDDNIGATRYKPEL